MGGGQQRRDRLHARELVLDESHRSQFTALREFAFDGADRATHREQGSMIRRYIAWRNRNTGNPRLRRIVGRANVA